MLMLLFLIPIITPPLFKITIIYPRYYGEFGMQHFYNLDVDVDVVVVVVDFVDIGAGHPHHHISKVQRKVTMLLLLLFILIPITCFTTTEYFLRYYGEFGMPDLWNHTNCPDPCLTYSCPKVFKYSTTEF